MMCGEQPEPPDLTEVFVAAFGATPAEARAAAHFARGLTARETAAAAIGAAESTVRGQLKAVYAKAGVSKAKDFVRLAAEAGVLVSMARTAETVAEVEGLAGRLRLCRPQRWATRSPSGTMARARGRPVLVTHGTITGRTLPPALCRRPAPARLSTDRAAAAGVRPHAIIATGDYVETAADDMAGDPRHPAPAQGRHAADPRRRRCRRAGLRAPATPTRLTAGDAGPSALPGPEPSAVPDTVMGAVTRAFVARPELVASVQRDDAPADPHRPHGRHRSVASSQTMSRPTARCCERPGVLASMVRDIQAMAARTSHGFAHEQSLYARGWTPPALEPGTPWLVVECGAAVAAGRRGGVRGRARRALQGPAGRRAAVVSLTPRRRGGAVRRPCPRPRGLGGVRGLQVA
jgi:DNA-binding CsgD family transcriptional regulator